MRRPLCVALTLCFGTSAAVQGAPKPATAGSTFQDQQPQYPPQDQQQDQQQYPQDNVGYQNYSPEQLDNLLSPIALYPDPLLAQVFVAATFPDQVEEAARFVRAYGPNSVDSQNWDVSVRSVAHYPTVIGMMADKIDWTISLGQAYVNQSTEVASTAQRLRHMARHAGNLVSTPQEEIIEHGDYIAISPYQPQYIYVPVYDPAICYYRRPYWGPAITFGIGYPIGAWLNLDFQWGFGGGWGGVYYTGWRREGWGGGCWNCGWIGRSREHVEYRNNVYINNRYTNINVNRTVVNRTVNVNNINNYNYVHKNVNYNNVQANNTRIYNRSGGQGNGPENHMRRVDEGRAGASNPGVNNKIMDRNIDRGNPRIDQYRGRDNPIRNDRPANVQQRPKVDQRNRPMPQQQNRPEYQQPAQNRGQGQQQYRPAQQANPAPHSFGRSEGNFDPRATSQRGQASRQQVQPPRNESRPVQQPNRPAPQQNRGAGERRKP